MRKKFFLYFLVVLAATPVIAQSAPTADIGKAACENRAPCRVLKIQSAGKDGFQNNLHVVSVARFDVTGPNDPLAKCTDPTERCSAGLATKISEDWRCAPFEYWSVTAKPDGSIGGKQLLLEICNDGYGASGVGTDTIKIGENLFEHAREGGSSDRWLVFSRVQLSPLKILDYKSSGFSTLGRGAHEIDWSWEDIAGELAWDLRECDKEPAADEVILNDVTNGRRMSLIPAYDLPPDFVAKSWQNADWGMCPLVVNAAPRHGYLVHGANLDTMDAHFSILAAKDGTLFLEIRDDKLTGPSGNWLADDHVELWLSDKFAHPMTTACYEPDNDAPALQWIIRLTDGKVFPGHRSPTQNPTIERVSLPMGRTRLKITPPFPYKALTVAYSDSDDGQTQEHLLATSKLRFGADDTLGLLYPVSASAAQCVRKNDVLELEFPRAAPDQPVVPLTPFTHWHSTE